MLSTERTHILYPEQKQPFRDILSIFTPKGTSSALKKKLFRCFVKNTCLHPEISMKSFPRMKVLYPGVHSTYHGPTWAIVGYHGLFLTTAYNICMYVCMYVCIYIYIYTHVYIYIYIYTHIYTYAGTC